MDLALVERLICPERHRPTPLVVRADDVNAGHLEGGLLGCPECGKTWAVTNGVATFGARSSLAATPGPDVPALAALLSLTDPGLVISDGARDDVLSDLAKEFDATIVALDSPALPLPGVTAIDGAQRVPLAAGTARGALMLRAGRDADFIASAARALIPGGRMVAAGVLTPGDGLAILARDEQVWVAEYQPASSPVTLTRRG